MPHNFDTMKQKITSTLDECDLQYKYGPCEHCSQPGLWSTMFRTYICDECWRKSFNQHLEESLQKKENSND